MIVKSPELKKLIMEVLLFTDDVEEIMNHPMQGGQGTGKFKAQTRKVFMAQFQRGRNSLRELLTNNMEIGTCTVEQSKKPDELMVADLVWVPAKDFKPVDGMAVVGERHTDAEIEVTEQQIKALKHYRDDRELFHQEYSNEALDALEELLKGAIPANA